MSQGTKPRRSGKQKSKGQRVEPKRQPEQPRKQRGQDSRCDGHELTPAGRKYLACLVDPRGAPAARTLSPLGGYMRRSATVKCKSVFDVQVSSTTGYGYLYVSPTSSGPTTDCPIGSYSDATTYTGTNLSTVGAGGAGTLQAYWQEGTSFTGASALSEYQLMYRCVSCAVYITPDGSANSMNGTVTLLEAPTHGVQSSQVTLGQIQTNRNANVIRGTQFGDPGIANVLNWHPTVGGTAINGNSGYITGFTNDFMFRQMPVSANSSALSADLLVAIGGLAAGGATYHVEVVAVYEVVGTSASGLKKCRYSQADMDLIMNSLGKKNTSGWVGKPSQAVASYESAVTHTKDEMSWPEQRKIPTEKRNESPWWKDAIGVAKDVAGFILS